VERLLIGLRDFAIEKVVSHVPPVFEARWTGKNACPHCTCENLRVKDSFRREIRNISIHGRPSRLLVEDDKKFELNSSYAPCMIYSERS